jgi:hypothetical protein
MCTAIFTTNVSSAYTFQPRRVTFPEDDPAGMKHVGSSNISSEYGSTQI